MESARLILRATAVLAAALVGTLPATGAKAAQRPNVLFIAVDDLND